MNRHERRRLLAIGRTLDGPQIFTQLKTLVLYAKRRSMRGIYDGRMGTRSAMLIRWCSHLYSIDRETSARLIYTRDAGHHMGGWWKNPYYERCLHLSISFCANPSDEPLPFDKAKAQEIAQAFFGDDARKAWIERPYSEEGKHADVHHYRVFCDEAWSPILPGKEVYSTDDTPAGWQSFSEVHGLTADQVDAPFLLNE